MATARRTTTIALAVSTKRRLRRLAQKGETYDAVVVRLIQSAASNELDDRWNRILREEKFIPLEELE